MNGREIKKSQEIRILDVLFIGPFLLYLGWKGRVTGVDRIVLFGLGGATILYNLNNYLRNKDK